MNKLPLDKRVQILHMLCEGSSMRSIARVRCLHRAEWLVERLAENVPTLVGIDHGFSFPLRYFEVHGLVPDWPNTVVADVVELSDTGARSASAPWRR